jgi:hypothetical protein
MRTGKRISLALLAALALSAAAVVAPRPGHGRSAARPKKLSVKVLRKQGDFPLLPTRQEAAEARKAEEREVRDEIPAHVPVKIKLRNEKKAKDLNNDGWLADLEIEVRNTGTKPIYFLRLGMSFVDVKRDSGTGIGHAFVYGRMDLIDIGNRATAEDVPLLPGETHVFKLHEEYVKGWNWYRTRVEVKPQPKKIRVYLSVLSHGDGTGYMSTSGTPVSDRKKSSYEGGKKSGPVELASAAGPPCSQNSPFELASLLVPANSLPVLFYPLETGVAFAGTPLPQSCCTGQGISCAKMKLVRGGNCFCPPPLSDYGTSIQVDGFRCEDPLAQCKQSRYEFRECGEGITFHTCTEVFLDDCGTLPPAPGPSPEEEPTPTPQPTPEPTPQPCPSPDLSACCLCLTLPAQFNPTGISHWDCNGTLCQPLTQLPNGCFIPNADGSCPGGFTLMPGKMCCPTVASGGGGGGLSPKDTGVGDGGGDDPSSCTPYYWYYYESWDDGETWEVVDISYAGCW